MRANECKKFTEIDTPEFQLVANLPPLVFAEQLPAFFAEMEEFHFGAGKGLLRRRCLIIIRGRRLVLFGALRLRVRLLTQTPRPFLHTLPALRATLSVNIFF